MGDSDLSMMGNFKGVMLCNRPAQIPGSLQTVVGPTSTSGPTRPAFVSAVVPEGTLGLPPVRNLRVAPRRDTRSKADDVTWRHKKWLGDFAERRAQIADSLANRAQDQGERAKRFADRAQATRDAIRGIKGSATDREEAASSIAQVLNLRPKYAVPTEYTDVSQQYPQGAPQPQQQPALDDWESAPSAAPAAASTARKAAAKPSAKAAAKPGWARTSTEDDDFLDAEADGLLDFAAGLDYERYIDDLEVREAIKFVQDRVRGLEESKQSAEAEAEERARLIAAGELEEVLVVDDTLPPDAEGNPQMKKIVRRTKRAQKQALTLAEHEAAWASAQAGDSTERAVAAAADALSRTALESNRALRNIHSSASVRAIMEKEQQAASAKPVAASAAAPGATGATTLRRTQLASVGEGGEASVRPPVITTIHAKEAGVKTGPNPSNLPFLYRHPGI